MSKWRWDQGRLDYFQFDEIKNIAKALVDFTGKSLPRGDDPDTLRLILENFSDRPFAPESYKVWRNYKRVFGCQLLATDVNGLVICTELCKEIAQNKINSDEYLITLSKRFYYSSPVFDDYNSNDSQVFPICAVIKFLVSKYVNKNEFFVSIEEIIDFVKGNKLSGFETVDQCSKLNATGTRIANNDDELRQIREMMRFISQISFLKWKNPYLFLDVKSKEEALAVAKIFEPVVTPRLTNSAQEILQLGRAFVSAPEIVKVEGQELNPFDVEFSEGSKLRISHIRTERSGKLREFYFQNVGNPHHCDMCTMDTLKRYPWADRILELHHLLPLSSPIRVEKNSSSLKDLVGLCPSCHRATHKYYTTWFRANGVSDFSDYRQAKAVYHEAKDKIVI